jgi:glycosyltransferase involved in cell wall biosynthesis
MSRWVPTCVVFVSEAGSLFHAEIGYAAKKMEVIPNGFDLHEFRPDPDARCSLRKELGVAEDALLIGMAARFHPQKDHHNFVLAAERLHALIPEVHFLLCGEGINWQNSRLSGWIENAGIRDFCHLLGPRQDMSRLFAGIDIATTSFAGNEAFPLVIGEAMACGAPCVVTDVGDSALIVDETGRVVPPRNPEALAEAWRELIDAGPGIRRHLGMTAKRRVQEHFSLPAIVERYQTIYAQLAGETRESTLSSSLAQRAE